MDYMPKSKDRSRGELEKLREMTLKEKLEYIWEYYSYYIVGITVAVILIISLVRTCYLSPDIGLTIAWDGIYIESEQIDALTDELGARLFEDGDNKIVESTYFFAAPDDAQVMMAYYDRLIAMIASGSIDIFMLDWDTLEAYSILEYVQPLDEILSELRKQDPGAYERIAEITVAATYGPEETASEQTVGIRITDSALLGGADINLYTDVYLCVSISATNLYNTLLAIAELTK